MCISFLTATFVRNKNTIISCDLNEVKLFLNDVSNSSFSFENIIKKHLCIETDIKKEEQSEKVKWTILQLSTLRSALQNDNQWEVIPYSVFRKENSIY